MRQRVDAAAAEPTARWLGIASGLWATNQDLREYRDKYHVRIPLTLDESGVLFRAFRVTQVPAALVANGAGRIVHRLSARDVDSDAAFRAAIEVP